ncbi:hypothetical protein JKP88DRAFT_248864 [Tribonema minus]|uniref:Glucose-methanol-choline oxidoreductase N-terminal domain-containing protein n=1 Tax=Tribonema minus TaxID=303371 RepID=A0A835YL20_9STRA|nr:hypothetical protein JKP88DRAFT_248864 [Tribonema minus]
MLVTRAVSLAAALLPLALLAAADNCGGSLSGKLDATATSLGRAMLLLTAAPPSLLPPLALYSCNSCDESNCGGDERCCPEAITTPCSVTSSAPCVVAGDSGESVHGRSAAEVETYDYIVVGAGTAGNVVAAKLANAKENFTVLLLEAGPRTDKAGYGVVDSDLNYFKVPGLPTTRCPDVTKCATLWNIDTITEPPGRGFWRIQIGKHTGGTGGNNIIGFQYTHASKADFNKWAALGPDYAKIWGPDKMAEVFKSLETATGELLKVSPDAYGSKGPIQIGKQIFQQPDFRDWYLDAWRAAGLPVTTDHNGPGSDLGGRCGLADSKFNITPTGRMSSSYRELIVPMLELSAATSSSGMRPIMTLQSSSPYPLLLRGDGTAVATLRRAPHARHAHCRHRHFAQLDQTRFYRTQSHGAQRAAAPLAERCNGAKTNFKMITGATVTKIVFASGTLPARATAVRYRDASGNTVTVNVRKDVIVSGGIAMSPALLMQSCVGPKDHLRSVGVPVVADNPKVGSGLKDQILVTLFYKFSNGAATYLDASRDPVAQAAAPGLWETGEGTWTTVSNPYTAYLRSDQIKCTSGTLFAGKHVQPKGSEGGTVRLVLSDPSRLRTNFNQNCNIILSLTKPAPSSSTQPKGSEGGTPKGSEGGTVRLVSSDPLKAPRVTLRHFVGDPGQDDLNALFQGLLLGRQVGDKLSAHATEIFPFDKINTMADLWAGIQVGNFYGNAAHAHGSARLVDAVDHKLRVRGTANVHIADASVIPQVSVRPAATIMAVGAVAGDLILQAARAPRTAL